MPGTLAAYIATVRSQLGVPYVYGGDSPSEGFDCSGLLFWAAAQQGVAIPRDTWEQWAAATSSTENMTVITEATLAPGDCIYFSVPSDGGGPPQHVGMYVGLGEMIDAPHTGTVVSQQVIPNVPGVITPFGYARITGFALPPPPPAPSKPQKEDRVITFLNGQYVFWAPSPAGHPLVFNAPELLGPWSVCDVTDDILKTHPDDGPYTVEP
jgi:hypothetical protein